MKYILFDLDGTVTDPALGITNSVAYALKKYGIEETYEDLLKFIGPPLTDSFKQFCGFDENTANQAVVYYREYFSVTGLFENKVFEGMEVFLEQLIKEGYRLAIATSKPEVFAKKILDHFSLSHYFTFIGGATMDSSRSKKADVVKYVMEQLAIKKEDSVMMVGDRLHDIEGAHQNNIRAIGVLYGYGDMAEMKACHADYIVKDLEELYTTIKKAM